MVLGFRIEALLGNSAERYSSVVLGAWNTVQIERALSIYLQLYRDIRYSLSPRYELELAFSRLCWLGSYVSNAEVKKAIEPIVKEKTIKGSLESKVTLSAGNAKLDFLKKAESELKDAFIVSELEVKDNGGELEISVEKAEGEKCERCWAISKTVGQNSEHPTLCSRCCENLK